MKVKLTIYNGEKEYFSREISTPCVIGRGKQSDVAILHPLISRQHCEIYDENGQAWVRDLGSLNGTFFKGARIGRGEHIEFGSSFSIGKLVFQIDSIDDSTQSIVIPIESDVTASVESVDSNQEREELRQHALDALEEFEKIEPQELGLAPEPEPQEEPEDEIELVAEDEIELVPEEEIELVSEEEAPASFSEKVALESEPNATSEQREEESDGDDLIDLEKFLKGEL